MTEVENLILDHLRHMRSAIDAIREDQREMKMRLGNVENQCAVLTTQYATVSTRLDRLDSRVERIERRLDLVDVSAS